MNGWGLGSISEWSEARTRSASGENADGRPGGGARAELGSHSTAYASRRLPKGWKKSPCHDLAPGETYTVLDAEGPGAIQHIWCTVLPQHLRSIVLRIHWDGAAEPSVAVPLGDFFCQGWARYAPVTSMPVTVAPAGGLNSYWPMPFRSRCTITVENLTENTIEGFFHQITWTEEPVAERASYLHACWRRSNPLDAQSPHVIVDGIAGRGHYVGTYLAWRSLHAGWWGEGEVKFHLDDDDEYPSICGTGTEDYFGGAWAFEHPPGQFAEYSTPWLGMPQVIRPDHFNDALLRFGLYRWHVMDPIRFSTGLSASVQALGFSGDVDGRPRYFSRRDDIASTAFWYADEPRESRSAELSFDALDPF
ncbi:glycoside hydrolase family 172 protein [Propionibacteriaceae bacterium Y1685]|uniref:glycoside hydrolase family 172 protein n=1 Tax=Microlunatus sp. Y1700 TaxID=3418487 RepID=UPI003B7C0D6C